MKKILLQALFVMSVLAAHAQIMIPIGNQRYDISEVDSIVFKYVEMPSATTGMENTGAYDIFAAALKLTGLADSLTAIEKNKEYVVSNRNRMDRNGNLLYYPRYCHIGWTVFAETDKVFHAAGINSFADLKAKCAEWYGNCSAWYDYINETGIQISTGDDYKNPWNVVNMFVAYHILRANLPVDKLVYEYSPMIADCWNYCFGYEPQSYYETMLPGTLLKVWQTNPKTTKDLWINRYLTNNTLTDQYATFGSDAMHQLVYSGAKIDRFASLVFQNANVHSIDKVLLYDQNAHDAQHERMRFHVNQMLPELATNGIMRATPREISALNYGGDGYRVAFANDYFDNLRCYDENTRLQYCVLGAWRALESTMFQGNGKCDFAIRLPQVPSGKYEIRIIYPPMARGGEIEFYIGNSSDVTSMTKLSTLNAVENPEEGNMGYERIEYEPSYYDDPENPYVGHFGIEAGKVMRQKGYMYAPASFSRGTYNTITDKLTVTDDDPYAACRQMIGYTNCRSESGYGTMSLRYIIGTVDIKQSQEYWLRINNRATGGLYDTELGWVLNFIELVPTDIAENGTYMEDWY